MYFGDAVKAIYADNGSFFDLMLEDEMPKVIDYSYLNHELIISEDNELKSIEELRIKKEFVLFAKQITCQTIWDKIIDLAKEQEIKKTLDDYISMKDEDMNLLVNQLIFDVLLYNYMQKDFKNEIKLPEYCGKYFFIIWVKNGSELQQRHAIFQLIKKLKKVPFFIR